ncbi:MAG: CpsB/CapC family capsule biosynthesis tyrosine phosphatase [Desulfovermiculus sp.]
MIDIHCHILPGIDDGPAEESEALEMARLAVEDGITDIICTPHHLPGLYPTSPEHIHAAVRLLQKDLNAANIPLTLHPGMEVHISAADPELVHQGKLLSLNRQGNALLVELPHQLVPPNVDTLFWSFITNRIRPVLAHVERYPALLADPSVLAGWARMGVMSQITASSLLGRFGPEVEDFAWQLIEHNLAHIVATDAHSADFRRPHMREAAQEIQNRFGRQTRLDMTQSTPLALLQGVPIDLPDPLPFADEGGESSSIIRRFLGWVVYR